MKAIPKLTVEMVVKEYTWKWLSTNTEQNLLNRNHWKRFRSQATTFRLGLVSYFRWLEDNGHLTAFYTDFLNTPDENKHRFP